MEHLPPTGWADVATKRDLDQLRAVTKADIDSLGDRLRVEFHKSLATHTIAIVFATMASNVAAVFAVAQLK